MTQDAARHKGRQQNLEMAGRYRLKSLAKADEHEGVENEPGSSHGPARAVQSALADDEKPDGDKNHEEQLRFPADEEHLQRKQQKNGGQVVENGQDAGLL